jgi:hypothetical protein
MPRLEKILLDPLTSILPGDAATVGAHPSFTVMTGADGVTDYEPTAHYLANLVIELLNRSATRVVAAHGVREIIFHDHETVLDGEGRLIQGLPEGEVAITIHFDPTVADPSLTVGHRVAREEADLRETLMLKDAKAPFLPTLADLVGTIHTALDEADLAQTLPFPYLDALQYGNHLFVAVGDGVGGNGGYFRVVAERLTAEQFQSMQYLMGMPEAMDDDEENA